MTIYLYDTLTTRKKPFEPLEPGHARIYVCGVTVYDYVHLGHMRCYTVYDVLIRHLRDSGLKVTYVRNVTDIDDKIIQRSQDMGKPPLELAEQFAEAFQEDMQKIGVLQADMEPRVSDHLGEIHALIQRLIEKGVAYESQGDVYFHVRAFPGYGKLSHRSLSDLSAGASGRLDDKEGQRKRDPEDFALWKKNKPGEISWDSPWGKGRPGWHIECSAMSMHLLGETLDLHGGGLDLVFPHHENEIAQSEAATGKPFARHWMHNGFVEVAKEKMSKSLGNFFTARECFRFAEPEAFRYFVLTVHYRAPLNLDWTVDEKGQVKGFPQVDEAERRVEYIYNTRIRFEAIPADRIQDSPEMGHSDLMHYTTRLKDALNDDLNMPVALAATAEFLKQVNELAEKCRKKKGRISTSSAQATREGFAVLGRVLGLGNDEPEQFLIRVRNRRMKRLGMTEAEIEQSIQARLSARQSKNFQEADAIRSRLAQKGIELMDGPDGTTWRIP